MWGGGVGEESITHYSPVLCCSQGFLVVYEYFSFFLILVFLFNLNDEY